MMGNGIDAELRLGVGHHCSSSDSDSTKSSRIEGTSTNTKQHQHQITIFYNGRICVCDVTEIQARSIISTAKREMDEMKKQHQHQHQNHDQDQDQQRRNESSPTQIPPSSTPALPQILNPGLSMKRSLQRFLQKREARINAAAPYNIRHRLPPSPSL